MVKGRGQLSPEFIVSALLFLAMMITVFSSFMKVYFSYASDYNTENVYMIAEKYLYTLIAKTAPSNWVDDPFSSPTASLGINGTLDLNYVKRFGGLAYPQAKYLISAEKDFNLKVRYLPSLSVVVDHLPTYPMGNMNMSAEARDIEGNVVNASVYAILIPPQDKVQTQTAAYSFGRSYWGFNITSAGHYRLTVVAFDGVRYGMDELEVEVT